MVKISGVRLCWVLLACRHGHWSAKMMWHPQKSLVSFLTSGVLPSYALIFLILLWSCRYLVLLLSLSWVPLWRAIPQARGVWAGAVSLRAVAVGELSAHRGWWLSPSLLCEGQGAHGTPCSPGLTGCVLGRCEQMEMAALLRRNKSTSEIYSAKCSAVTKEKKDFQRVELRVGGCPGACWEL